MIPPEPQFDSNDVIDRLSEGYRRENLWPLERKRDYSWIAWMLPLFIALYLLFKEYL